MEVGMTVTEALIWLAVLVLLALLMANHRWPWK